MVTDQEGIEERDGPIYLAVSFHHYTGTVVNVTIFAHFSVPLNVSIREGPVP